jgi:hypothetical protein
MKATSKTLRALAAASLLAATGCEKNLLDQNNPNLATTATFWQTSDDALRASTACYAGLQGIGMYRRWLFFTYDGRADDGWSQSPYTLLRDMTNFVQTDYNFEATANVYRDCYRTIDRCNQVLANVPAIQMDATLRTRIISEAYFVRALSYFNLVSLFGNVPLSTQPASLDYRPAQGKEADVWALVISDLQAAIGTGATPNLPATYTTGTDRGRATIGAARTLLGKAYMQNKRWADAQAQFALVISSSAYSLTSAYTDNFRHTSKNNSESIFEVQFTNNNIGGPDGQGGVDATTSQGFQRPKFFGPPQNGGTANTGFTDCEVRPWVVSELLQEGTVGGQRDPRLAATVFYNYRTFASTLPQSADTLVYDLSRPAAFAPGTYGFLNRYKGDAFNLGRTYWRKYQSDYYRGDEDFDSPNNFRVMRYADVLLLQAEALNEQGQTAAAVPLINLVRQRAGLAPLVAGSFTQATLRTQLRHERVTELTGEGLRWFDLQRYGLLDTQAGIDQLKQHDAQFNNFVVGKSRLLPLPQQDVNLVGLTQNTGY